MLLEHVAINVSSPVEMADWYVNHCKMRIVLQIDEPPFTRFLADQEGKTSIEIYKNETAPIPDYHNQNHLVYHHAFSVEHLEETRDKLIGSGATFVEEVEIANGTRLVMLRDPWGIPLQLVKRAKPWY